MKKIILVLMLAMMVGACGESATDVATGGGGGGGGGGFIPPDTVIKTADGVYDVYLPGNPAAVETVRSLAPRPSLAGAIETSETFGYTFDPARVAVATVTLADGRDVTVALGALVGLNNDGHVVYVRVGDREEAVPLRLNRAAADGFDVLEIADKGEIGPQGLFSFFGQWWVCLLQAVADIMACRYECESCWRDCVMMALIKFINCFQFTQI